MYNSEMFDAIGMLEPSGRGELENADVNSYILTGCGWGIVACRMMAWSRIGEYYQMNI